jgi:glycine/D-amino acid oxidase-like deaminating enzyme
LLAARRAERVEQELRRVLTAVVERRLEGLAGSSAYQAAVADLRAGRVDPYEVAERLLESG